MIGESSSLIWTVDCRSLVTVTIIDLKVSNVTHKVLNR